MCWLDEIGIGQNIHSSWTGAGCVHVLVQGPLINQTQGSVLFLNINLASLLLDCQKKEKNGAIFLKIQVKVSFSNSKLSWERKLNYLRLRPKTLLGLKARHLEDFQWCQLKQWIWPQCQNPGHFFWSFFENLTVNSRQIRPNLALPGALQMDPVDPEDPDWAQEC